MISRIEASAYCRRLQNFNHWKIANSEKSIRIRINGNLSSEEIGSIVAKATIGLKNIGHLSVAEIFDKIIETGLSELVRVRFVGDSGIETINGCCSDFSVWTELYDVKYKFVWLGHSPMPEIDYYAANETVRVWIDGKYKEKNSKENSILFTWREFKANLENLRRDLLDFSILLEV